MEEQIKRVLTDKYQSEAAIVRAIYPGRRDSQISYAEWGEVLQTLPSVGQSKNIGRNEYIWRAK